MRPVRAIVRSVAGILPRADAIGLEKQVHNKDGCQGPMLVPDRIQTRAALRSRRRVRNRRRRFARHFLAVIPTEVPPEPANVSVKAKDIADNVLYEPNQEAEENDEF
jgi:hypothetical protein